ncbi:hypothetical protein AMECASPLE_025605 [Ameca splendens]|uniref:Uncharacterized protein n=1 Tax=Ameca splendens TaxID=208324 RepID=A0ABV0YGZ7_9TELE
MVPVFPPACLLLSESNMVLKDPNKHGPLKHHLAYKFCCHQHKHDEQYHISGELIQEEVNKEKRAKYRILRYSTCKRHYRKQTQKPLSSKKDLNHSRATP